MKKWNCLIILLIILPGCDSGSSEKVPGNTDNIGNTGNTGSIISGTVNTDPPSETVKIMFIHHSAGSAWIANGNGNLGSALNNNNYYVTESDYYWDAEPDDNLGDSTDTIHWPSWFNDIKMPYVYANNENYDYTNVIANPGGENGIIMFKSCYPNSDVGNSIDDEKLIYNSLLDYFGLHEDKLFILVVPPPMIVIDSAPLTRELANWLSDYEKGWLAGYGKNNVRVFDYYNVLTDPNNHHYVLNSRIRHIVSNNPVDAANPDELYYPTSDNHPNPQGHQKATGEFLPLLNAYYHMWKDK